MFRKECNLISIQVSTWDKLEYRLGMWEFCSGCPIWGVTSDSYLEHCNDITLVKQSSD